MTFGPTSTPVRRSDVLLRRLGAETVIWSPIRSDPAALDPATSVMLDVIDGAATVEDLVHDVRDVVGVPGDVAQTQVERVLGVLHQAGALATSEPESVPERQRKLFINPPSS